jgi:hypothetical protein
MNMDQQWNDKHKKTEETQRNTYSIITSSTAILTQGNSETNQCSTVKIQHLTTALSVIKSNFSQMLKIQTSNT